MKTSTRKRLGVALLGASLVSGVVLSLTGTSLVSIEQAHPKAEPDRTVVVSGVVHVHWALAALLTTGTVGLLLLLMPPHEKANAHKQ